MANALSATTRKSLRSTHGTAYQLSGHADAETVILIHGIGLNRRIWRDYEPALAKRYRVLSYDLYGHGESARPKEPLSLSAFAGQLRLLMDELAIHRCAVIGFSMGGMINRRFTLDHPERVSALVILNSPHERSPEAQKLVEDRVTKTAAGGPEATLQASLERWFTPGFLAGQTETIDTVTAWILNNDPVTFTQSRQVLATGVTELIRPRPPISHPTLVMTCQYDSGSTPEMADAIAREIANAESIVIPELQHLGMLEQPQQFLPHIEAFLRQAIG